MRRLALACLLAAPLPAAAQTRIVHDTLGADMPTQITCGFCATEQFGVVFRELPAGRRGLEPTDFPLTIDAVDVGLGAANVESARCVPQRTGGTIVAALAIYAGDAPPTGSILALPEVGEWPGETLVWASDEVPITLSVENEMGQYELMFNHLEIRDDVSMPVRVEAGRYLRVVFTLPAGAPGTSDICAAPLEPAGGYPVRDNDGRIADERSFIFAAGAGWFWNEAVPGGGIDGDWGVRLSVFPSGVVPGTDGGAPGTDAGAGDPDAGATMDGGGAAAMDAGADPVPMDGCSCRVTARSRGPAAAVALLLAALVVRRAQRRRRAADGSA